MSTSTIEYLSFLMAKTITQSLIQFILIDSMLKGMFAGQLGLAARPEHGKRCPHLVQILTINVAKKGKKVAILVKKWKHTK